MTTHLSIPAVEPLTFSDVVDQAERASRAMSRVRGAMLSPTSRKSPPTFTTTQLASLCGIDRNAINYRLKSSPELPTGRIGDSGRREFTLAEVEAWTRVIRSDALRPDAALAAVVSVANFKGGVLKTSTTMTVAQGLSMRGHKVLVIDCDPQGSLTTLFGLLPDAEVEDDQTVLPVCLGQERSLTPAIQATYWPGIDLVAASPSLFSAEFALPARQQQDPTFEFWNALNFALDEVRTEYDVILIDTPPALSYITINAIMASHGLIIPLPANAIDFASAAQFWRLFSDLATQLSEKRGVYKEFDFIRVLLTRVDGTDASSSVVRDWISQTYGTKLLPVEVPKTNLAATAAAEFGTIYDLDKTAIDARTYKRAADAYEKVVEIVEQLVQSTWRRMVGE